MILFHQNYVFFIVFYLNKYHVIDLGLFGIKNKETPFEYYYYISGYHFLLARCQNQHASDLRLPPSHLLFS